MQAYRIRDWNEIYENNRTRELKSLSWVPIPNKLDGDGYTEIMQEKNGTTIYGAWVACVLLASRCDPRGTLVRSSGEPHTCDSISRITRIPINIVAQMLDFSTSICMWMEIIDIQTGAVIPQDVAVSSRLARSRNGMKERKKEGKGSAAAQCAYPAFEEFEDYCKAHGFGGIARKAFDYYNEAHWIDGKGNKVLNWKQKLISVWFKAAEEEIVRPERLPI